MCKREITSVPLSLFHASIAVDVESEEQHTACSNILVNLWRPFSFFLLIHRLWQYMSSSYIQDATRSQTSALHDYSLSFCCPKLLLAT